MAATRRDSLTLGERGPGIDGAATIRDLEREIVDLRRRLAAAEAELAMTRERAGTEPLERALRELRETNRALLEAKAAADEANQSKTRFIAAASHDLLQPLNAARLFVSALAETEQSAKSRALIENIEIAFESVDRLLAALLDISRLDAGVMRPEPVDVPIMALLKPLVAEFAPIAEKKDLRIRLVPSSAVVRTDPNLISRVIRNLVSNAVRYTVHGGVVVGARPRGQRWAIEVVDSGIGIPASKHEAIFEEFHRLGVDSDAPDRGFGLGLAIVKRMTRLLGHDVQLRSRPGHGSRFSVIVPRGAQRAAVTVASHPLRSSDRVDGSVIAVIENERGVLDGMQALLQGWGCTVVSAEHGEQAVAALRRLGVRPDLVIADYHLDHGEIGSTAIDLIRTTFGEHFPGIVITADRSPEVQRAVATRSMALLNKPVRPARLRALMRHLMDGNPPPGAVSPGS